MVVIIDSILPYPVLHVSAESTGAEYFVALCFVITNINANHKRQNFTSYVVVMLQPLGYPYTY